MSAEAVVRMNAPVLTRSAAAVRAGPRVSVLWWLLVLGAALYFGFFALYPEFLAAVGVNYFGVWFLDSFAILASNDALARGMDVYAANPLDYFQRPHVYSEWWLNLGRLGLTRADNFRVGLLLVLAFFGVALAGLRPRDWRELLWYLAVLCSSPVLLAVHRANNDLAIFVLLAGVVPCLLSPLKTARVLAALLIAFVTGLKFYPAAAALLLLAGAAESRRHVRLGLIVGGVAIALVLVHLRADLQRMGAMLPHVKAEGLMTFGAGNILGDLGISGGAALAASLAAALAIAIGFWRADLLGAADVAGDDPARWLRFVLGAVLLTGCFFTGMNFAYRWVFALWLAPFLWRTLRDHRSIALRRFATITAGLLLIALWADPLAAVILTWAAGRVPGTTLVEWANRFFLVEQPFTWAFFACLIGWLVHFSRGSFRRPLASYAL
jgi:hypothetical protein